MPARNRPPTKPAGSVLSLVPEAPRPTLEQRGRLLFVDDMMAMMPKLSRSYFNHNFLREKRVKVGRLNAWWECDVIAHLDAGGDQ